MKHNDAPDLQRTPQYTQPQVDIPIPENALFDPQQEYNQGELDLMDEVERSGYDFAREVRDNMIEHYYEMRSDYIQGYSDALEIMAQREA